MILTLTGTTYPFDSLVQAIDRIAPQLDEPVVVQTGASTYVPKHCEHFAFAPDINHYIEQASMVVCHGGAGSSFEILGSGKPLVSVENRAVNDSHQWDLLQTLDAAGYIVWCRDLSMLGECMQHARAQPLRKYTPPGCTIHEEIFRFLDTNSEVSGGSFRRGFRVDVARRR